MPRLFRQSPLNAIWEGSGNVICLDILRTMLKEPVSVQAFMREVCNVWWHTHRSFKLFGRAGMSTLRSLTLRQCQAMHVSVCQSLSLLAFPCVLQGW